MVSITPEEYKYIILIHLWKGSYNLYNAKNLTSFSNKFHKVTTLDHLLSHYVTLGEIGVPWNAENVPGPIGKLFFNLYSVEY